MKFRKSFMSLFMFMLLFVFIGCGSDNGGGEFVAPSPTSTSQKKTITGYVVDDPVKGANVYIVFDDGTKSTQAITSTDGSYELKLSEDDLLKINPIIPDGADGPKDDLIIVAEKDGKILRNAIDRDVENRKTVYISNDTEAYAEYLEAIGEFTASALTSFNNEIEKGRIKDSSDLSDFIKDIREDVKSYFYGGDKPTAKSIFEKAFNHLGAEKLAHMSDHSSYVAHRDVMSGGDIILPSNVTVESDDITLTSKGNGRFTIGDGSDGDLTVYLKVVDSDIYRLIPVHVKDKQVIQISSDVVTVQKGKKIENESISVNIPPYAILQNKTITFNKVVTQGETADGKMILDMQPSGLKFDLPITIKVKYSDFGVTDPNAVEWKYGSVDGGYEDADIVNIDKDSRFIYLNVSHFSNLVVREIKSQKYLDLAEKFIVHIPRRNHILVPTTDNQSMIQEKRLIISNRLFEGSSTSNLQGSDSLPSGGGQCVQFADNVYYPLKIGKKLNIPQAYITSTSGLMRTIYNHISKKHTVPNGVRERASLCAEGDVVAVDSGGDTGHIAIYKNYINNKLYLIQSNDYSDKITMYGVKKKYKTDKAGYHERFTFGNIHGNPNTTYAISQTNKNFNMTEPSNPSNTFLCLDPNNYKFDDIKYNASDYRTVLVDGEKTGKGTTTDTFATTYGFEVNATPWMYYLLNRKEDGVSIYSEKSKAHYYGYEPDVLPVAPLRLDSNYNLTSDIESRYEIYVSKNLKNNKFKLSSFSAGEAKKDFDTNISSTETSLNFSDNTLYKLKRDDNTTEFKLVPRNGVTNFESRYELRTSTKDTKVDTNKKVLFSPNVIDDYYVNWSKDNKYNTSKILIGFWNSYGYDIPLADNGGRVVASLVGKKIYKSFNAINGYFMTLADGDKAEWHFSLAGTHAIFVHVPTGDFKDIKNAEYIYTDVKGNTYTLKPKTISQKLSDSAFKNWFVLYKVKKNGKKIDKKEKKYSFELGGSESLKVTAKGGVVVVDSIRLQGRDSLEEDLTAKGTVTISDKDDLNDVIINVIVKDENGKEVGNIKVKASNVENVNMTVPKTSNSKLFYFFYLPFAPYVLHDSIQNKQESSLNKLGYTRKKVIGGSSSSSQNKIDESYYKTQKVANNTTFLSYAPTKLTIKVKEGDTEITLPKVVLQKSAFVDTFTFNVKDGSNTALNGVNIDIKYGIDNDSELVVYSGTTDSSGKLEINQLAYGQYTATLSLGGYAPRVVNFTVSDTQVSIDEKMVVAQGSTLEGSWIADSNYVPNVSQASYKNSISIEQDGSNYKGTYKSIYSWYPDEYCGLLTSTSEADFTAVVNGEYLDLTFTSNSGDVRTECDDGSWVNAKEFSIGETLQLKLNSNNSGILSLKYDACGWSHDGVCEQRMPLFYKFREDKSSQLKAEIVSKIKGSTYTEYKFNLLNIDDFERDILDPLENTPSQCGNNAPRTWLEIFDQDDNYIYGFCSISDFDDLKSKNKFWFSISNDNTSITGVKIKLHDRRENKFYSSNILEL